MILRPYQEEALDAIWEALQVDLDVLLSACCSSGKTLLFSKVTQRLLKENPSFRVTMLMDREILVTQSRDKLLKIAPELALKVGIACNSVSKEKDLDKSITIASRQTLASRLDEFIAPHLLIIDECHLAAIPKEDQAEPPDQFGQIIAKLREYNPQMRLLGVTASPYRLVDGYIYGDNNVVGAKPYFKEVCHEITVKELEHQGYLAPLIGKTAVPEGLDHSLKNMRMVAGEYNLGDISSLMSGDVHIRSAVETWQKYASDRHKTIAFCVTIEHAEKMAEAFNSVDIPALAIHSELDTLESYANMEALENGDAKVFCSVAKLTTGMDVPDIDCLLMARPTKSTALYKQILGRGQRIFPGKDNCLVLDLVGNSNEFGTDLDRLKVTYRRGIGATGVAMSKSCPECNAELHPAVKVCPECDYAFTTEEMEEAGVPDMVDTHYGSEPPEEVDVTGLSVDIHESAKNGRELLKVQIDLGGSLTRPLRGFLWLCFPGDGYSGYAVKKGRAIWEELSVRHREIYDKGDYTYPSNAKEAFDRQDELSPPERALVDLSGKYPDIKEIIYDEVPF